MSHFFSTGEQFQALFVIQSHQHVHIPTHDYLVYVTTLLPGYSVVLLHQYS